MCILPECDCCIPSSNSRYVDMQHAHTPTAHIHSSSYTTHTHTHLTHPSSHTPILSHTTHIYTLTLMHTHTPIHPITHTCNIIPALTNTQSSLACPPKCERCYNNSELIQCSVCTACTAETASECTAAELMETQECAVSCDENYEPIGENNLCGE